MAESKPKPSRESMLEAALVDLLRAPYMEWYPMAIHNGCILAGHPDRYAEGHRPKFAVSGCACSRKPFERVK